MAGVVFLSVGLVAYVVNVLVDEQMAVNPRKSHIPNIARRAKATPLKASYPGFDFLG